MNILVAWAPSDSHTEFSDGGADLSFFVVSTWSATCAKPLAKPDWFCIWIWSERVRKFEGPYS
jgi:hypothetical protein